VSTLAMWTLTDIFTLWVYAKTLAMPSVKMMRIQLSSPLPSAML